MGKDRALSKVRKLASRLSKQIEDMKDQLEDFEIELDLMQQIIDRADGTQEKQKKTRKRNTKAKVKILEEELDDDTIEDPSNEESIVEIEAENSTTLRTSRKFWGYFEQILVSHA